MKWHYIKETKGIMKNCMLKKEVLSAKPVITWLSGNAWLLESARGQKVNIICGSKIAPIHSPRVITIQSNLEVLNLESECWIENAMFETLRMIKSTQNVTVNKELFSTLGHISTEVVAYSFKDEMTELIAKRLKESDQSCLHLHWKSTALMIELILLCIS